MHAYLGYHDNYGYTEIYCRIVILFSIIYTYIFFHPDFIQAPTRLQASIVYWASADDPGGLGEQLQRQSHDPVSVSIAPA